jgi:predicted nucleic-acid-binding Zn-ribbon protein
MIMEEDKPILCNKCGNDKFVVQESTLGSLYIGCSKCGNGNIFGRGVTVEHIVSILKDEKVIIEKAKSQK